MASLGAKSDAAENHEKCTVGNEGRNRRSGLSDGVLSAPSPSTSSCQILIPLVTQFASKYRGRTFTADIYTPILTEDFDTRKSHFWPACWRFELDATGAAELLDSQRPLIVPPLAYDTSINLAFHPSCDPLSPTKDNHNGNENASDNNKCLIGTSACGLSSTEAHVCLDPNAPGDSSSRSPPLRLAHTRVSELGSTLETSIELKRGTNSGLALSLIRNARSEVESENRDGQNEDLANELLEELGHYAMTLALGPPPPPSLPSEPLCLAPGSIAAVKEAMGVLTSYLDALDCGYVISYRLTHYRATGTVAENQIALRESLTKNWADLTAGLHPSCHKFPRFCVLPTLQGPRLARQGVLACERAKDEGSVNEVSDTHEEHTRLTHTHMTTSSHYPTISMA